MEKGPETMSLAALIEKAHAEATRVFVMAKKYSSPEARDMAMRGDVTAADLCELSRLEAAFITEMRQDDGSLKVFGEKTTSARLIWADEAGEKVVIRVDQAAMPDIWLEIKLPLAKLTPWLEAYKAVKK